MLARNVDIEAGHPAEGYGTTRRWPMDRVVGCPAESYSTTRRWPMHRIVGRPSESYCTTRTAEATMIGGQAIGKKLGV